MSRRARPGPSGRISTSSPTKKATESGPHRTGSAPRPGKEPGPHCPRQAQVAGRFRMAPPGRTPDRPAAPPGSTRPRRARRRVPDEDPARAAGLGSGRDRRRLRRSATCRRAPSLRRRAAGALGQDQLPLATAQQVHHPDRGRSRVGRGTSPAGTPNRHRPEKAPAPARRRW